MHSTTFSRSSVGILFLCCMSCLLGVALFVVLPLPAYAGTTITVDTMMDELSSDGRCSLREAIYAANTNSSPYDCPAGTGADIIILPSGTYTLTLGGSGEDNNLWGDLDIINDLEIRGAGSGMSGATTIDANGIDRVFDIMSSAHVTLTQMNIQGGTDSGFGGGGIRNAGVLTMTNVHVIANYTSSSGGGLYNVAGAIAALSNVSFGNNSANFGGAIYNSGKITLTNVGLGPNAAATAGGGLDNWGTATLFEVVVTYNSSDLNGGGIYNGSSLTLERVSLDNNVATNGNGGGIYSSGQFTLTNVTLSANDAMTTTGKGGSIFKNSGSAATLTNVTLNRNAATAGGGIYRDATSGAVTLKNTIIANSASGGNCGGSALTSQGYNLDSANTCGLSFTGDLTNTPPFLGSLADNGGWMKTHALLPGSPAINRIPAGTNGCGTTITTDQRRAGRPIGGACDIGAYEAGYVFLPLIKK